MLLRLTVSLLAITLAATPALGAGNHAGGHHDDLVVGKPGDPAKVSQTITISMKETEDGRMIFEPAGIAVTKGETVRLTIRNDGEIDHEFVLDGHHQIMEHKVLMEKFPEMEHDDPNAIRLTPGQAGDIVWHFSKGGTFKFACLVPGHYDAGMHGDITVAKK